MDAGPSHRRLDNFEEVALPQFDALFNLALHLTHNRKDAEDLVQETFLKAYRFFDSYKPGTHIKAWLFRILRNTFINRYRATQARPQEVELSKIETAYDRLIEQQSPEDVLLHAVLDEEIQQALHSLPEEYRSVVVLALIEEMSYKEIAFSLSIPVGTVMSRLHRGRRLLQTRLLEHARRKGILRPRPDVVTGEDLP